MSSQPPLYGVHLAVIYMASQDAAEFCSPFSQVLCSNQRYVAERQNVSSLKAFECSTTSTFMKTSFVPTGFQREQSAESFT